MVVKSATDKKDIKVALHTLVQASNPAERAGNGVGVGSELRTASALLLNTMVSAPKLCSHFLDCFWLTSLGQDLLVGGTVVLEFGDVFDGHLH